MERITINLVGKSRSETRAGRRYLVSPATLIVPGVLNGSQGALYYPAEEVSRDPSIWNGIPLVVRHPVRNGQNVSARNPEVLESQGVGTLFHSKFTNKLIAEAWFDVEDTERVEPRILNALEMGKSVELSTGLFTDNKSAEKGATAEDGTPYDFIARNYRPDHLAVLPDQIGACSVEDGCGINVNKDDSHTEESEMTEAEKKTIVDGLIANTCCWEEKDRETLNTLPDDKLNGLVEVAKKDAQRELVANAARKGFTDPGGNEHTWNEEKQAWETKVKEPVKPLHQPVANEKTEPQTTEEWLETAPEGVREAVVNSDRILQRERTALVEQLTANVKGEEPKKRLYERLQTKPVDELRDMLALLPEPVDTTPAVNYGGAAAPAPQPKPRDRSKGLTPPTLNFQEQKSRTE